MIRITFNLKLRQQFLELIQNKQDLFLGPDLAQRMAILNILTNYDILFLFTSVRLKQKERLQSITYFLCCVKKILVKKAEFSTRALKSHYLLKSRNKDISYKTRKL